MLSRFHSAISCTNFTLGELSDIVLISMSPGRLNLTQQPETWRGIPPPKIHTSYWKHRQQLHMGTPSDVWVVCFFPVENDIGIITKACCIDSLQVLQSTGVALLP